MNLPIELAPTLRSSSGLLRFQPARPIFILDALRAVIPWSWISCYTKLPNFPKLSCIARSQSNPWNIFLSLAVNTFSCCHFLYFWNYFVNILYTFANFALWRLCVSDEMEAITRRRVGRPKLPDFFKSIQLREYVFNLWTDGKEALGFSECTDSEFAV